MGDKLFSSSMMTGDSQSQLGAGNKLGTSYSSEVKVKRQLSDYVISERQTSLGSSSDLGKGAFGIVKLVRDTHSGKLFAMKIIQKQLLKKGSLASTVVNEVKIQKRLKHPHIVQLKQFFEDVDNVYLILEYCENGSLYNYIRKKSGLLSEDEAFIYLLQTALGLEYLHSRGIIHRDLKPENLLMTSGGDIKICDFGWSAMKQEGLRDTFCGTIDFMAPEILEGKKYDKSVDMWSLGVLLYEVLNGFPPYPGCQYNDKKTNILENNINPMREDASAEVKALIQGMMNQNPAFRYTFDQVFNSKFVQIQVAKNKINLDSLRKRALTPDVKLMQNKLLESNQDIDPDVRKLVRSRSQSDRSLSRSRSPLSQSNVKLNFGTSSSRTPEKSQKGNIFFKTAMPDTVLASQHMPINSAAKQNLEEARHVNSGTVIDSEAIGLSQHLGQGDQVSRQGNSGMLAKSLHDMNAQTRTVGIAIHRSGTAEDLGNDAGARNPRSQRSSKVEGKPTLESPTSPKQFLGPKMPVNQQYSVLTEVSQSDSRLGAKLTKGDISDITVHQGDRDSGLLEDYFAHDQQVRRNNPSALQGSRFDHEGPTKVQPNRPPRPLLIQSNGSNQMWDPIQSEAQDLDRHTPKAPHNHAAVGRQEPKKSVMEGLDDYLEEFGIGNPEIDLLNKVQSVAGNPRQRSKMRADVTPTQQTACDQLTKQQGAHSHLAPQNRATPNSTTRSELVSFGGPHPTQDPATSQGDYQVYNLRKSRNTINEKTGFRGLQETHQERGKPHHRPQMDDEGDLDVMDLDASRASKQTGNHITKPTTHSRGQAGNTLQRGGQSPSRGAQKSQKEPIRPVLDEESASEDENDHDGSGYVPVDALPHQRDQYRRNSRQAKQESKKTLRSTEGDLPSSRTRTSAQKQANMGYDEESYQDEPKPRYRPTNYVSQSAQGSERNLRVQERGRNHQEDSHYDDGYGERVERSPKTLNNSQRKIPRREDDSRQDRMGYSDMPSKVLNDTFQPAQRVKSPQHSFLQGNMSYGFQRNQQPDLDISGPAITNGRLAASKMSNSIGAGMYRDPNPGYGIGGSQYALQDSQMFPNRSTNSQQQYPPYEHNAASTAMVNLEMSKILMQELSSVKKERDFYKTTFTDTLMQKKPTNSKTPTNSTPTGPFGATAKLTKKEDPSSNRNQEEQEKGFFTSLLQRFGCT